MLQLRGIIKEYAGKRILNQLDWHLRPGERVGLCGENGAGKTTLLKLLGGRIEIDGGELQCAKGTTVGYLPQDGLVHEGQSLVEEVRSGLAELLAAEQELRRLEESISRTHDEQELARYAELQERFEQQGGYALDAEVGKVLGGLGFVQAEFDKPCEQFSGGWQMRIALAKLLLQRPNLLLLDEPTNHLDLPARDWLESYLSSYPGTVVLVSHDRFFLDQVVTRIVEVWHGQLTEYACDYSRYLVQRDERVKALREAKRRQDEEVERMEAFINKFRYNANKASLVQSRIKQLEKIERIDLPPERKRIRFSFPAPPKGGRSAVELKGVEHGYGELRVLNGVDVTIEKGDRVALVGPNGAGKSTLMRMLSGVEKPLVGERVEGHNLEQAYFAQDQAQVLDGSLSVLQQISDEAPVAMVPKLRNILGSFLFSGDDVEKKVKVLSGGERNRLALAILLLRPANLLLLDEPTNHLDLLSKEVLLDALQGYAGTLVFVSHDRYFVDALATRIIEVGQGRVTSYHGNYEDYLRAKEREGELGISSQRVEQRADVPVAVENDREAELSYAERKAQRRQQQRLEKALAESEAQIEKLEAEKIELEERMADPQLYQDQDAWHQATARYEELKEVLAAAYARWEELGLEQVS